MCALTFKLGGILGQVQLGLVAAVALLQDREAFCSHPRRAFLSRRAHQRRRQRLLVDLVVPCTPLQQWYAKG